MKFLCSSRFRSHKINTIKNQFQSNKNNLLDGFRVRVIFCPAMSMPTILLAPSEAETEPKYFLRSTYVEAITGSGGMPILGFPDPENPASVGSLLKMADGLFLTGGKDLHPLFFGEQPMVGLGQVFPERDEFEIALARHALELGMPVLGVCRGMQVLNVAAGGTLHQDISILKNPLPILHAQTAARSKEWHSVTLEPESKLSEIFKGVLVDRTLNVNSIHHQAVRTVASGWIASAVAPDGIIEAVECPAQPFAIGVQWHPEELERHSSLFTAFITAAQNYRVHPLNKDRTLP
jgi:putative glutamine amidotransferase